MIFGMLQQNQAFIFKKKSWKETNLLQTQIWQQITVSLMTIYVNLMPMSVFFLSQSNECQE